MKKRLALLALILCAALLLSACASKKEPAASGDSSLPATANSVPTVLNTSEYVLYQNIFYNDYGAQYVGKDVTKKGIIATIQDAYNDMTRYYVWGYNDNTKCCDWQWEIVPADAASLPANGSYVTVTGTFSAAEEALDGYWITDAKVAVTTAYTGKTADVDMCTMSDTLERVQLYNMLAHPDVFEGKTAFAYGRVASTDAIEDPYYDSSWQFPFASTASVPAIGTSVVLRGTFTGGVLGDCAIEITK